jgi:hypothetical protein
MKTTSEQRAKWLADAKRANFDTPWTYISDANHETVMDYEGGTVIDGMADGEDEAEHCCGTDQLVHIANANPAHMEALLEDFDTLRSILSRVREWVDNAALVESEEREIRGILEDGR